MPSALHVTILSLKQVLCCLARKHELVQHLFFRSIRHLASLGLAGLLRKRYQFAFHPSFGRLAADLMENHDVVFALHDVPDS